MTARVQEVTAKHPDMILLDSRPCSPRLLLIMLLATIPLGYPQIAGGYYMIESGSCGGGLISTSSECEAAATALDLSDKAARML